MTIRRSRLQLTVETIRALTSSTIGAVDARTNRCGVSYRKC